VSVRLKVILTAVAMLGVFGVAVLVWAFMQWEAEEELSTILDYQSPVSVMIAEVDVLTLEYELLLQRLLRPTSRPPTETAVIIARVREIATRIHQHFERSMELLQRGTADNRSDLSDRLAMARAQEALKYLQRQIGPFLDLGRQVIDAYQGGRRQEAEARLAEFLRFEEAFGSDLAAVRADVAGLTRDSISETRRHLRVALIVGACLLGIASLVGVAMSTVLANHLHRALDRLIEATRAVEGGQLTVTVAIRTKDQLGQLARAFNRMVEELNAKDRVKEMFGKYIDPRIVANLIGTGSESHDAAERRVATVFFSDIKSFSAMSEQLTASAMVHFLNRYFTDVTAPIRVSQGIIDKYIGDSVMAFWTTPFSPGDSHAAAACLAALAQQGAVLELRKDLSQIIGLRRNVPDLVVRMGLATGEVVAGTIGSPQAKSYTVIGDTVNLASRLEGVNKVYGTTILISEDTYRLAQSAIEAREIDFITVAGKTEPIRVFELLAPSGGLVAGQAELRDAFQAALEAYRHRDWDLAGCVIEDCLRIQPADGPARVFRDRVARLRAEPPPDAWDGVWHLTQK
jgi:adenylate cyclase